MAEFGEQLKKAREAKGMTQQTLAEQVYVTRQTVSRWEGGSRYPDLLTLRKLSAVLGVSTDELLSNDDLPELVEHSPIVEKPIVNNLLIALYAASMLIFMIQSGILLSSLDDVKGILTEDSGAVLFTLIKEVMEAALLVFGFANLLIGADTPKKSGVILAGFFALEALSQTRLFFYDPSPVFFLRAVVLSMPYAASAVGAYRYFFSNGRKGCSKALIYAASCLGVGIVLLNLRLMLNGGRDFINSSYLLSVLLRILILLSFCYQTYILGIRRTLAQESAK